MTDNYHCSVPMYLKIRAYIHSRAIREVAKRKGLREIENSPDSFYHELEGNLGSYVASQILCGDPSYAFECDRVGKGYYADFIFKGWAVDCKTTSSKLWVKNDRGKWLPPVTKDFMKLKRIQVEKSEDKPDVDFYLALHIEPEKDPELPKIVSKSWQDEKKMIDELLPQVLSEYELIGYVSVDDARAVFDEILGNAFNLQKEFTGELRPISELEEILKEPKPTNYG